MILSKIRSMFNKTGPAVRKELKIQASLASSNMVLFSLSENILPENKLLCSSKEQALGAPFLESIFELSNIEEVFINEDSLRVKFNAGSDLKVSAGEIGKLTRELWDSGTTFVPEAYLESKRPVKEEIFVSESTKSELGKQIQEVLSKNVAPSLAAHGGHVTLVDIKDGYVHLNFGGGCQGCSQVGTTVKDGVEKVLTQQFSEIKGVVDVTNHTSGENPYYR